MTNKSSLDTPPCMHTHKQTYTQQGQGTDPYTTTSAIVQRSFDATISVLDAETSAIAWSYRRYRRGVSCNIGDCGVYITPQMCNRVTNHGDMSTFSKPGTLENILPHQQHHHVYATVPVRHLQA